MSIHENISNFLHNYLFSTSKNTYWQFHKILQFFYRLININVLWQPLSASIKASLVCDRKAFYVNTYTSQHICSDTWPDNCLYEGSSKRVQCNLEYQHILGTCFLKMYSYCWFAARFTLISTTSINWSKSYCFSYLNSFGMPSQTP